MVCVHKENVAEALDVASDIKREKKDMDIFNTANLL